MSGASVPTQVARPDEGPAGEPTRPSDRRAGGAAPWRLAAAAGRLESRRLVRHPIFLAGVGFAFLGSGLLVAETVLEPFFSWDDDGWYMLVGFGMLGLLTMVAANAAALRDRRRDTEEQHRSLPAEEPAKTGGLLVAATLWPSTFSLVLLGLVTAYAATIVQLRSYDLVQLLDTVAGVAMSGALGVALARWIPNPFVAPLVAWGLIFASPSESTSSWQVLLGYARLRSFDLAIWHLVLVVSLAAIFGAIALLRRTRDRRVAISGIVGVVIASTSAVVLLTRACPVAGRCLF